MCFRQVILNLHSSVSHPSQLTWTAATAGTEYSLRLPTEYIRVTQHLPTVFILAAGSGCNQAAAREYILEAGIGCIIPAVKDIIMVNVCILQAANGYKSVAENG